MTVENVYIQNLKCGGCANSIVKGLSKIEGITNVSVDVETNHVSFESQSEGLLDQVADKLLQMGYPLAETTNTLGSKAKSYVSCMIGRMSTKE